MNLNASTVGNSALCEYLDGPVRQLAEPGCPVHVAAVRLRPVRPDDRTMRFASGWGATAEEAQQRCLFEAAERISAQHFGTEKLRRARLAELGCEAVPPPEIMLFAEEQHRARARWNKRHPGLNEVPSRWRPERAIDWIRSDPRLSSAERWLPAGLCFLGHERDRAAGLAPADSSGLAAGETTADAALRAFVELVQRDAVAIWWYHRIARPRISTERIGDALIAGYAGWLRERDRVLRLHDLTHDLGVPVVAAVSHHDEGGAIALGFGAGESMPAAARQAVGELTQCECNLALIAARAARQGLNGVSPEAKALIEWAFNAQLEEHPPFVGTAEREAGLAPGLSSLSDCHELCRRHGLSMYVVDLTRNGIDVPIVRAFVPGLRPAWARFAPGRLFDVPLRLGWVSNRPSTAALNRVPLMT